MTKKWLLFLSICSALGYSAKRIQVINQEKVFHIVQNDSTEYDLILHYDATEIPEYFYRNLFTPVCKSGECLPVTIILKWDLLGNFFGFDVPEDAPLTKDDHEPFDENDYKKLQAILSNENSLLEDFDLEVLKKTGGETIRDIDGVTGATPKNIANSTVTGAFYTCHTLWHFTYDHSPSQIGEIIGELANNDLLKYLLGHSNYDYQHYAIDKIAKSGQVGLIYPMLSKIELGNTFINQHILRVLPSSALKDQVLLSKLLSKYPTLTYNNRKLLIELVDSVSLSNVNIKGWGKRAASENEELGVLMLQAIANSSASNGEKEQEWVEYLETHNGPLSSEVLAFFNANTGNSKVIKNH